MIRRPPRSTLSSSSAASDVYKRQVLYRAAAQAGTKLVEVGDPKQLRGVGCGSLFGRVHELVGGAALSANRRQREEDERAAIAARTVAQWVHRIDHGQGLAGVDVLVLDEANLTDDRDRAVLYRAAAQAGTKLVEVGDPKQLRGVGCGSLFGRVHELVD